ncbi:hypothetical protein FRX31_031406 [Thalictrum thalictroides]|uniref:DUF4283 domain-containing protein n=1 Tax=Thalictrum thalictroides TaxID=46969 RepID=A0A7J6V2G7_THATH|nr:hypothetical protein FRX31_031406 [Thalictrum thalictroides]
MIDSMAKQPWSDLFRSSGSKLLDTSLEHYVPTFVDGIAEVPSEIISDGVAEWSEVVVGFFVDKRLPFKLIKDSLTKLWKLKGIFKMTSDKELFYFNFSDEEDRKNVVECGPVFIAGRFDETTFKKERLEFARVCVEIPSDHQFASSIKLNMGERLISIGVEYPWKPPCCSICACFGHKTSKCVKAPARVWVAKETQQGNCDSSYERGVASNTNVGAGMELALVVVEEEVTPIVVDMAMLIPSKGKEIVVHNKFDLLQDEENLEVVHEGNASNEIGEVDTVNVVVDGDYVTCPEGGVLVANEVEMVVVETPLTQEEVTPIVHDEDGIESYIETEIQQFENDNKQFLEDSETSEDGAESDDTIEPEFFKDHIQPKMSVTKAKRAARGKSVVTSISAATELESRLTWSN